MPLFIMIPFSEPYHTTVAASLQAQYLPNFLFKLKILCADFLIFNLGFCLIHRKGDFPTLLTPRLASIGAACQRTGLQLTCILLQPRFLLSEDSFQMGNVQQIHRFKPSVIKDAEVIEHTGQRLRFLQGIDLPEGGGDPVFPAILLQ